MVKPDEKWFETGVTLHQIIKRLSAVFSTTKGHNTVIAIMSTIFGNQFIQLYKALFPINFSLNLLGPTNVANTL